MLLSADSDRFDFAAARADFFEAFRDRRFRGLDPNLRILFHVTGRQTFDRAVTTLRERHDFSRGDIEDERFRAFGAAIDSETKHGEMTCEVRRI